MFRSKIGTITSPGLKISEDYPANVMCTWYLEVPAGNRFALTFRDQFDVEKSDSCKNDFVEVWQPSKLQFSVLTRKFIDD